MQVGQQFGPFTLERELGSGAMGAVYLARYEKTGQRDADATDQHEKDRENQGKLHEGLASRVAASRCGSGPGDSLSGPG